MARWSDLVLGASALAMSAVMTPAMIAATLVVGTGAAPASAQEQGAQNQGAQSQSAQVSSDLDWRRMAGAARDVAISHDGQRWMVGLDGRAYRWDVATQDWQPQGRRSDLARLDVGTDGVAALTEGGLLVVRDRAAAARSPWRVTSAVARDLGLGAGRIWLAGGRISGGAEATQFALFSADGLMDWTAVPGSVARLDVDPVGRPWAAATDGIYVFADGEWIRDPDGPVAQDIGVGGDGTIYAVDQAGQVIRRDARDGSWLEQPGQVVAITAGPDGKAMGADAQGWILAAVQEVLGGQDFFAENGGDPGEASGGENSGENGGDNGGETAQTNLNQFAIGQQVTLADLIGDLPGAAEVIVTIDALEFAEDGSTATLLARGSVFGVSTRIAIHQPDLTATDVLVVLRQDQVDLANYVPGVRASTLGSFGLAESLVFFPVGAGGALELASYDDLPAALAPLFPGSSDSPVDGLFPLQIQDDVTLAGLYTPPDGSGGSGPLSVFRDKAALVAGLMGLEQKTFVAKGSFRKEQLANLQWNSLSPELGGGGTSASDLCQEAAKVDLSGLDVRFALPNWSPDFAEGLVTFNQPTFALRSIEGAIEPAILAGLTVDLPEATAGLEALNMAGRIAVRTPPETLCGTPLAEADLRVAFAGATTFGAQTADLNGLSFDTLAALSGDDVARPVLADRTQGAGWQDPFGLPYLEVVQYASSGVFTQSEGARGIDGQLWLDTTLGRAAIDVLGTVQLSVSQSGSDVELDDWSLTSEGPVLMADLPGLSVVPGMDALSVFDLSFGPDQIEGAARFADAAGAETSAETGTETGGTTPPEGAAPPAPNTEARLRLTWDPDDLSNTQAFLRFEDFTPERSARFMAGTNVLPPELGNYALSPAIVGINTGDTVEASRTGEDDWLWAGVLAGEDTLPILTGMTMAAGVDPQNLMPPDLRSGLSTVLDLGDAATLYASFPLDGTPANVFEARLNQFDVRPTAGLAYGDKITFENSKILLDRGDDFSLEFESDATFSLPVTLDSEGTELTLAGTMSLTKSGSEENLSVALDLAAKEGTALDGTLPKELVTPLSIPDLVMTAGGVRLDLTQVTEDGQVKQSERFALVGTGRYKSYPGTLTLDLETATGGVLDGAVSFAAADPAGVPLSVLLPNKLGGLISGADANLRRFALSKNAIAADMTLKFGALELSGLGAVVSDGSQTAVFLRHDDTVEPAKVFPAEPRASLGPLANLGIPGGVFVAGTQEAADFAIREMPTAIYQTVLGGYVDDRIQADRLLTTDGFAFLTKMDVEQMPATTRAIVSEALGISGSYVVAGAAGGVFNEGADRSFGLALALADFDPPLPDLPGDIVSFNDSDLTLFAKATQGVGGASPGVEVGLSATATLRPVRLDTLEQQVLPGVFSLTYAKSGDGPLELTAGAEVTGTWVDPLGLEGYSFEDPKIAFGIGSSGTLLEVATKRGSLRGRQGAEFAMDLSTTWVGGAPTSLAAQFARVAPAQPAGTGADTAAPVLPPQDLELRPSDLMRAYHSFFALALRSGAAVGDLAAAGLTGLGDQVQAQLEQRLNQPLPASLSSVADQMTVANLRKFLTLANGGNDAMLSLLEASPLAMVGVRNPVIYFGTPGSVPPKNAAIDPDVRPPLGFGLYVGGELFVDAGGVMSGPLSAAADLEAEGSYRVDLRGYQVDGSFDLPGILSGNRAQVSGRMPLLVPGSPNLTLSGRATLPDTISPVAALAGLPLPGTPQPYIAGSVALSGPQIDAQRATVTASLDLFGIRPVDFTATLDRASLPFRVPASCTMPFAIEGTVPDLNDMGGFIAALPATLVPEVPDPVECLGDLGQMLAELGQEVGETVVDIVEDPGQAAAKGFRTAERLAEDAAELAQNPAAAIDLGKKLAKKPADVATGLTKAGFGFAKAGAGKVPVVGPVAAEALGAVADTVGEISGFAQQAVMDNAVSGWVTSSLSNVGSSVVDMIGSGGGAVIDFLGGGSSTPTWYRINPLRCHWGRHYWNPLFSHCFENGAVVILDEDLRQPASTPGRPAMGPCMSAPFHNLGQVRVTECAGNGSNQFHFDPSSRTIHMVRSTYNGYNGRYVAHPALCMTRAPLAGGGQTVVAALCGSVAWDRQEWSFTDEGRLQSGSACAVNTNGSVLMGSCATATRWTASALMPNWNEASNLPVLGQITNAVTGQCTYWRQPSGPWQMRNCTEGHVDVYARNSVFLRLLGGDHRAEIMGSRAWDGAVHYGCMGADLANGNYLLRHCYPWEQAQDAIWAIDGVSWVNGQWQRDPNSLSRPIAEVMAGHYRLRNVATNRCLAPASGANLSALSLVKCPDAAVPPLAVWRGFKPDRLGISAEVARAAVARQAAVDRAVAWATRKSRLEAYPALLEWQRARTRAENQRINAVFAKWTAATQRASKARLFRTSPAHCVAGQYWDHVSNSCKRDNPFETRFPIVVTDEAGQQLGCMRARFPQGRIGVTLWGCDVANAIPQLRDIMGFAFDQDGRIRIRKYDYRLVKRTGPDGVAFLEEERVSAGGDSCLRPTRSRLPIDGQQLVAFMRCQGGEGGMNPEKPADPVEVWRMSPSGELISHDGRCVRTVPDTWNNGGEPVMVLQDCQTRPMQVGQRRFQPQLSQNLNAVQGLPQTARLVTDAGLCLNTDLQLGTAPRLGPCAGAAGEYFAFGADSANAFLISPRDAKTCLEAQGDQTIQQEVCTGATTQAFVWSGDRLVSAQTGLCLGALSDGTVAQLSCDRALSLSFDLPTDVMPSFASEGQLSDRTTPAVDALVNAQRQRSSYLWMGAYLGRGDRVLQKDDADNAIVATAAQDVVAARPMYMNIDREVVSAPALTVPATTILTLPGFEDGPRHVTFAHARPVQLKDAPTRTTVTDPYKANMADWMVWMHEQKVLTLRDDGSLGFDYIEETPAARLRSSFRMGPARNGVDGLWSFESLAQPGQYLAEVGGGLVLSTDPEATSLRYESTTKWLVSEDRSGTRGPQRPAFKDWAYPASSCSFLTHNPHNACPNAGVRAR